MLADVTKLGDLDALYAQVWDEFKRIDVLFANAGVPGAVIASRTSLEGIFENDHASVSACDSASNAFLSVVCSDRRQLGSSAPYSCPARD